MKKTWSFYETETGALISRTYTGSPTRLDANTPPGTTAIEGALDPALQCIDVKTGEILDKRGSAPLSVSKSVERATLKRQMDLLELGQQRPMRELLLAQTESEREAARMRLAAVDSAIDALRVRIAAVADAGP
jgi:translation initiation factor 2 gamma subunit (eIF-2gamma)